MKGQFSGRALKLFAVVLSAVMLLCSCGAAGDIADAVLSSAGAEISSAVSKGMEDLSDGMDELKSGVSEAASAIGDAKDNISEQISSAGEAVTSIVDEAVKESMSRSLDSLADEISQKIDEGIAEGEKLISSLNDNTSAATDAPETSASSDDTTTVPETKHYTFRNQERYDEHYKKHGAEFGDITQEQYLELANELIASTSDRVLHKYSSDGDYMYFDQDTEYFLVLSEDGYIRTFFIPSAGINYWNRQ